MKRWIAGVAAGAVVASLAVSMAHAQVNIYIGGGRAFRSASTETTPRRAGWRRPG